MIHCFVDDSGNSDADPSFILAGWTGKLQTWNQFVDDWRKELAKPKSIDYYKHSDAAARSGCFEKFTVHEATQKTIDLATVIAHYHIYPFVVTVPRAEFKTAVIDKVIKVRRRKINRRVANLFPAAFGRLIPFVFQKHYELGVREQIDFIIDSGKSDKALRDAITVYRALKKSIKANPNNPFNQLAGEIIPGDDQTDLPLQAADLLAGQIRRAQIKNSTPVALNLWKTSGKQIWQYDVSESDMKSFVREMNVAIATDRLEKIRKAAVDKPKGV